MPIERVSKPSSPEAIEPSKNDQKPRRLRHLYRTAISSLAEMLWELGVSEVYMGYPMYISQDNGNEYNANIWWFRKMARWLGEVLGK